ncbi:Tetratricopeptide-like helical [Cordyceps fumosorosea ARSEF 2679]|uniref:Tetratricopeptide-like helical n=1 Tax=Cordyceps fumosorosea (strain ARSEF 2679) TaxID=1081104 RepID=A0A167MQ50_CORFA|nr:Tetratricopeptide-like helical [Cordyceps fumosorosea ARSEF 2679]OAA54631.1 Tetratricopeptide-like helical [Cordyceps fumosorosea ARSEF 2679]
MSPNPSLRRAAASPRPASSPASQIGEPHRKDFSFLLRPEIYHPLTPLNVPLAFRSPPRQQPDPRDQPEALLARGHFRAAAIAAVQELTGSGGSGPGVDARDTRRIFDLLYARLACLTLIDATPLAAQEVKALEDLNSARTYVDDATGEHLVPWALRVLNVRLQALGFGDPRRAVMSYHDLAREARERVARAAARRDHSDAEFARECARRCAGDDAETTEGIVLALCDMADGEHEAALARWRVLSEARPDDEMISVNAAVCLLYLGRIVEGRDLLEGLVDRGCSSHTLLFNLSTMYELCTDRSKALKVKLTERVAAMGESPAGWERTNADFKL